jgi:hypothetical protein
MIVDDNKREYGMGSNFANLKPIREEKLAANEVSEKQLADGEYLKTLQKALQTAINENEEVSKICLDLKSCLSKYYFFKFTLYFVLFF